MANYKIDGMTCEGCARSVQRAIARVAPKAKISIDLRAGLARIEGAPDDAAIAKAVVDAGYKFGGRAPDPV